MGQPFQLVVVQHPIIAPHAVLHGVEPLAGKIGRCAMRQVPTGRQAHPQDRVTGFQQCKECCLVRLCTGMRLHVGELAGEQPLRPIDGELLGHIDIYAAAVVAPAWIALGILVGQHGALRFQHRGGDDIFAGNELDAVLLADQFGAEDRSELRIRLGKRGAEEPLRTGGGTLFVHD